MRLEKYNNQYKLGQTMLELVFVIGATVVTLVALTRTVVVTLNNVNYQQSVSLANKMVQKRIEEIRIYRDDGGFEDWEAGDPSCYEDVPSLGSNWIVLCSNLECSDCSNWYSVTNTDFFQQIEIKPEENQKIIKVYVSWGENKKHRVSAETIISKWEKHE